MDDNYLLSRIIDVCGNTSSFYSWDKGVSSTLKMAPEINLSDNYRDLLNKSLPYAFSIVLLLLFLLIFGFRSYYNYKNKVKVLTIKQKYIRFAEYGALIIAASILAVSIICVVEMSFTNIKVGICRVFQVVGMIEGGTPSGDFSGFQIMRSSIADINDVVEFSNATDISNLETDTASYLLQAESILWDLQNVTISVESAILLIPELDVTSWTSAENKLGVFSSVFGSGVATLRATLNFFSSTKKNETLSALNDFSSILSLSPFEEAIELLDGQSLRVLNKVQTICVALFSLVCLAFIVVCPIFYYLRVWRRGGMSSVVGKYGGTACAACTFKYVYLFLSIVFLGLSAPLMVISYYFGSICRDLMQTSPVFENVFPIFPSINDSSSIPSKCFANSDALLSINGEEPSYTFVSSSYSSSKIHLTSEEYNINRATMISEIYGYSGQQVNAVSRTDAKSLLSNYAMHPETFLSSEVLQKYNSDYIFGFNIFSFQSFALRDASTRDVSLDSDLSEFIDYIQSLTSDLYVSSNSNSLKCGDNEACAFDDWKLDIISRLDRIKQDYSNLLSSSTPPSFLESRLTTFFDDADQSFQTAVQLFKEVLSGGDCATELSIAFDHTMAGFCHSTISSNIIVTNCWVCLGIFCSLIYLFASEVHRWTRLKEENFKFVASTSSDDYNDDIEEFDLNFEEGKEDKKQPQEGRAYLSNPVTPIAKSDFNVKNVFSKYKAEFSKQKENSKQNEQEVEISTVTMKAHETVWRALSSEQQFDEKLKNVIGRSGNAEIAGNHSTKGNNDALNSFPQNFQDNSKTPHINFKDEERKDFVSADGSNIQDLYKSYFHSNSNNTSSALQSSSNQFASFHWSGRGLISGLDFDGDLMDDTMDQEDTLIDLHPTFSNMHRDPTSNTRRESSQIPHFNPISRTNNEHMATKVSTTNERRISDVESSTDEWDNSVVPFPLSSSGGLKRSNLSVPRGGEIQ